MKSIASVLILAFLSTFVYSQTNLYTYGGPEDEIGNSFCLDGEGGYVFAGSTRSYGNGSQDIYIVHIDNEGNLLWAKTFGSARHETARAIERTADGGYAVYGSKWDGGSARQDSYLLKLNYAGNQIWAKYYGGSAADDGIAIQETSDGGFVMAGFDKSTTGMGDFQIIKIDSEGNEVWYQAVGGSGKDIAFDVIETKEGDFLVTGLYNGYFMYSEFEFITPDSNIHIYKLDKDGTIKWEKTYDKIHNELVGQTVESPDGGYYILGSTQSAGAGSFDIYLMKLDTAGNIEWEKTYGDVGFDYGASIAISDDNYLYITGTSNIDLVSNKTDVVILKTDLDGNEIWTVYAGGEESEYGKSVRVLGTDGCAVLGYTKSAGNGQNDFYFIKLNDNGVITELTTDTNSNSEDEGLTAAVFPNPASEKVNFSMSQNYSCHIIQYELYHVSGNLVYQNIESQRHVELDISTLAPGLYMYRITSTCYEGIISGKLIVH
ncbi:MAG: T9SS type A sorting domain-containing protein [Flavobacteriales bacterium]|nr:T9SS type A sorting domain-containing protein [Flavobacteriales bacterium]